MLLNSLRTPTKADSAPSPVRRQAEGTAAGQRERTWW